MTVDVPHQVPSEESRATRPAVGLVLIVLGHWGVLCALV